MVLADRKSEARSPTVRRWGAALFVLVVTMFSAVTAPVGPLYAQIYPGDGGDGGNGSGGGAGGGPGGPVGPYPGRETMVVTSPKGWERALTKASLSTGFEPERLVENERARFTATIGYARNPDPGPTVQVAYANDAVLLPHDPAQFDVDPVTDERQNLDEGRPDGKGGLTLSWGWDVTPRATGSLTLQLEIKPIVFMGGSVVDDLARRNKPIKIDVMVHPNRQPFNAVVAASNKDFAPHAPPKLTAEKDAVVTADLPLHGSGQIVQATLVATAADGSAPVTVDQRSTSPASGQDTVHGEWVVRAGKEGVVTLAVTAVITAKAGDKTLEERVERKLSLVVDPAPAFWPRVLAIVAGLTAILTLLGAFVTFHTQFRKPLALLGGLAKRIWGRIGGRRRSSASSPPSPGDS